MAKVEVVILIPTGVQVKNDQFAVIGKTIAGGIKASVSDDQRRTAKDVMPETLVRVDHEQAWITDQKIVGKKVTLVLPVVSGFELRGLDRQLLSLAPTWLAALAQEGLPYSSVSVDSLTYSD